MYRISQAWSSINPRMLVQSRRKVLPDPEDDYLQGFPSKEISSSTTLDMMFAVRCSENIDKH
jgi:hypothetical protein